MKLDKLKEKEAQIGMITGFLIVFFILERKGWEHARYVLIGVSILGVLFLLSNTLGSFIVKWWFKLAEGMGWVMSRIILSTIFFLFLFPLALLSKIFNKNLLGLKKEKGSAFSERNHTYTKEDLENIW